MKTEEEIKKVKKDGTKDLINLMGKEERFVNPKWLAGFLAGLNWCLDEVE